MNTNVVDINKNMKPANRDHDMEYEMRIMLIAIIMSSGGKITISMDDIRKVESITENQVIDVTKRFDPATGTINLSARVVTIDKQS